MSEDCHNHIENYLRPWAEENGYTQKLNDGLEYARTFSGGPESEWCTYIGFDVPHTADGKSFVFTVYRRVEKQPDSDHYHLREGLKHYMTIGMIWYGTEWGFHS